MPTRRITRIPLIVPALILTVCAVAVRGAELVSRTEMVPMRDGVKLATDVYWPADGEGPYPTILLRTPYGKGQGRGFAAGLCPHGYAVVVQDMRGRFDSEGHHAIIFANDGLGERKDGHDTINWIAKQRWSNKKIAMAGGSAGGIVQNMAAPNAPESLKGTVPVVAFSNYYEQAAYQGGVWRQELLERWLEGTKMTEVNLETFKAHPYYDDFWKPLNADAHADQVNAPGMFVGGWYDIFAQGTINSFTTVQEKGGPGARGKCFLVMRPIAHGGFNELIYPAQAHSPPINLTGLDHYAHWLKGEQNGVDKLKPVHYFVMGDTTDAAAPGNFWRSEDSWPPPSDATPFHFHADGLLRRAAPSTAADAKSYKYDPANPVPTVGGQNLYLPKGPMDQRKVESRPDVLVFTTEVLTEPVEVTGRITATLYVSSDCPDTDFTVKLCDVYPDGRSMLVTDGIRRASLRNGFEKPEWLKPGEVYEVEVDLWSTSLIFNKGHRIRVAVSSSNAPRFEPNANTGDPHPQPGKTRVATNTLHLSPEHASHILLPIYKGGGTSK